MVLKMYLQVTCANAWYTIQKSETENVFWIWILNGRFWHYYTPVNNHVQLDVVDGSKILDQATQYTIILIFIENLKLKSKIKTLIEV